MLTCCLVTSSHAGNHQQTPPNQPRWETLAGAYLDKPDLYTIQELCLRLSRERGHRMHFQEFAVTAFTRECARHGVKLTGKS
jgi:hypothetical protein